MIRVRGVLAARWAFLAACLLLVALPRFNLRDPGPIRKLTAGATNTAYGLPLDVEGYIRLADYFRGETPADSLIPPYCFRPLAPFIASLLPATSQTAINLLDLIALFLTVVVLDGILARIGFSDRARLAGSLLFIVSFPTFYYGTIGFVDPVALLAVALTTDFALRDRFGALVASILFGVLVKETNALLAFLPWIRGIAFRETPSRALGRSGSLVLLAGVTVIAVRLWSPFPGKDWIWLPSLHAVAENLSRPRAILSLILTLGLPGALGVISVVSGKAASRLPPAQYHFLLGGCGLMAFLYAYSLTSAYADGRVVWAIYPFLIPIALCALWKPAEPKAWSGLRPVASSMA